MYILMTYFTLFLTVSPLELKLQPATSRSFHSCFFLAFSLTLTNIFVRFNPISWWSCTIAGRVCASHWARKPRKPRETRESGQKPRGKGPEAGPLARAIYLARMQTTTTNSSAKWCRAGFFGSQTFWLSGLLVLASSLGWRDLLAHCHYLRAFCRKLVAFGFC